MAKASLTCKDCGYRAHQWHGRCPECGAWDSFAEPKNAKPAPVVSLRSAQGTGRLRLSSGIAEFDRVLGGGIVPGSIVLLAGEPGVGKSTLILQAAAGYQSSGFQVLLVCGEESLEQVAARAARVGGPDCLATSTTEVSELAGLMKDAGVVIVDSVQTLHDAEASGERGSPSQVRAATSTLAAAARATGAAVLLVGHVTKDGSVAGPKVLEHLVDAVATFEGERDHSLRAIRCTKNRFGPTGEVGLFEMSDHGLQEVFDPSGVLRDSDSSRVSGSATACVMEGRRPMVVEIQTLIVDCNGSTPRRVGNGVDGARLGVMAAVLESRADVKLSRCDIYARVAGGLRVTDPGLDLALALALTSSKLRVAPPDIAAIGEVGLGGEIRNVPGIEQRLREVERLGFKNVMIPSNSTISSSLSVEPVAHLRDALRCLRDPLGHMAILPG